ncbi:MAG: DUF4230 domain-containing protein [Cyanobacteria bacterium]|nr:DUF4230 domain-containing protein [Cyanobacteriota bacterium]MDW8201322.1 DUF4230 domain-containing protein [Cyanobacteriota bacterium SKYGB_h_bin112]
MNNEQRERGAGGCWLLVKNLVWMSIGGILLIMMLMLLDTWRSGRQFIGQLVDRVTAPQPSPQVDVRSLIVKEVRGVSELTTAVFTMEAVVPASRDRTLAGLTVGTTKLLYIARGEVRAGIDLSQITATDILVADNGIQVRLPSPRLIDSKIDVSRSQVYDYDRGFLSLGPDIAPELLTMAEREALEKVTAAACNANLLQQANDRAELVVTRLLSLSGYQNVTVQTQLPEPTACNVSAVAQTTLPTPPPGTSAQVTPTAPTLPSVQATPMPQLPTPQAVSPPVAQPLRATTFSSFSR